MLGRIKQSESEVTRDCVELLRLNHIIHWRNQSGSGQFKNYKSPKSHHIRMGTPGLADWSVLLVDGKTLYLELKKTGGKQSQDQIDFEADCIRLGVPYLVADCWQTLAEFLDTYGMLKVRM